MRLGVLVRYGYRVTEWGNFILWCASLALIQL